MKITPKKKPQVGGSAEQQLPALGAALEIQVQFASSLNTK